MNGVRVRTDLAKFRRSIGEVQRRQIPFALATAITGMAARAKADIQQSMATTFDRPRPYTLNAVFATRATKSNPRAIVGLKDGAGGSTPAWKFLAPEIDGGARRRKRFEKRLGLDAFAITAPGAKLDANGDITRAQLGQIIAALGQAGAGASAASATVAGKGRSKAAYRGAKGGRSAYFLAKSKRSGKPLAVYQVVGKGEVKPVLFFDQQAPTYQARWPLGDVVMTSLNKSRQDAFERAWSQALASARD